MHLPEEDRQSWMPLILTAAAVSLMTAGTIWVQVLTQQDLYPVDKFDAGLDYRDFYGASSLLREGRSPYEIDRYVTPPLPALVNVPLTMLPFGTARYVAMLAVLLAVPAAYLLLDLFLNPTVPRECGWLRVCCFLVIVGFSYPFIFLFDRGNIDGFILLLMCVGLVQAGKREGVAGVCFGLAIAAKLYPVLLFIPMVLGRRRRMLFFTVATLLAIVLVTPRASFNFVADRLLARGAEWRADENASLANTFYYVGRALDYTLAKGIPFEMDVLLARLSFLVYLVTLGTAVLLDWRTASGDGRTFAVRALLYFPFMVAVPQLTYHYELVLIPALVPAFCLLWRMHATVQGRCGFLILLSLCVAVTQFPAIAMEKLTGTVVWHFVPGFGLLLVLFGTVWLRRWDGVARTR